MYKLTILPDNVIDRLDAFNEKIKLIKKFDKSTPTRRAPCSEWESNGN